MQEELKSMKAQVSQSSAEVKNMQSFSNIHNVMSIGRGSTRSMVSTTAPQPA